MNNKNIIYIVLALATGLLGGYFLFGNSTNQAMDSHDHAMEKSMDDATGEEVWTCSMHPQIRQPEPGICPICEMDLILLEANMSDDPLVLQMTKTAVALANIQTTTIGETSRSTESKNNGLRLSGKIKADERRVAAQVAHVPGRIEKLYVSFVGEKVSAGQRLATIYSPDLITAQRELLEALKLQDINAGLVEAARNKLRYLKISESTIRAIEEEGAIRENFVLTADAAGIVTQRMVSVGDYVRTGEPLFELVNLNKVWVLFDAYETDLANISVGDRIEFTTPSVSNKTFNTRITFIDPVINSETRVATIRAEISNTNGRLKPEMFVTGTLQNRTTTANNQQQLSVPKTAVLWTGKRSVVYVKLPDTDIPSYQYREVELGERMGDNYQIINGLVSGEMVVTNGNFSIDAAAQLNNQASMMNQNIAIKGMEDIDVLPDYIAETPATFQQQLSELTKTYIPLKDAFVATDPNVAALVAATFLNQLEQVDMMLIKGEAHDYWMQQRNALHDHATIITNADEVTKQRKQFGFLSTALINTVQAFGVSDKILYVQHCPMAFDNEGADWLALEEGIRNPYFGDKMMKCGMVKKVLGE